MLDRFINILFIFSLIFIFILAGDSDDHVRILIAVVLSLLFALSSFILNWLTLDGALAALIFGTVAFGLGEYTGAGVVLIFFVSGSLISKDLISQEGLLEKKFRRSGFQVWANGFWFTLFIVLWFLTLFEPFMIAAVAAMACAAADTWSSEIGNKRLNAPARLITNGKKAEPGTEGAISFAGTISAIAGALLIAATYYILYPTSTVIGFVVIGIIGFLGSLIDSVLGATLQGKDIRLRLEDKDGRSAKVSNNMVNWFSTGITSIATLIVILITGL